MTLRKGSCTPGFWKFLLIELCSPKDAEVLILSTCDYDFILK